MELKALGTDLCVCRWSTFVSLPMASLLQKATKVSEHSKVFVRARRWQNK